MPDMFTTLSSISPLNSQVQPPNQVPGISPGTKKNIADGRAVAFGNQSVASQGHILDGNTVALWRFEELNATDGAADLLGDYDLLQFNSPRVVDGKIGKARRGEGNGTLPVLQGHGDAALGTVFNGDCTVEQWFNVDPSATQGAVLFIYNGLNFTFDNNDVIMYNMGYNPDGRLRYHNWTTPFSLDEILSNSYFEKGEWNHWALSKRALGGNVFEFKMYLNGVLDVTVSYSGFATPLTGANHFVGLGNYITNSGFGTGDGIIKGALDDTRVSNVVRTASEIQTSFLRGMGD